MLILDGESPANGLAFTADGSRLVTAGASRFDVWALPEGRLARSVATGEEDLSQCSVAVRPEGDFAFVAGRVLTAVSLTVAEYAVYGRDGDHRFDRVIVSPDGTRVITRSHDGRLHGYLFHAPRGDLDHAWEVGSGETLGDFIGDNRFVTIDWKRLVVRSVAAGEEVLAVPHTAKFGARLLASPDGSRLAGMSDTRLYVWDTAKWGKPERVAAPRGEPFRSFALHPTHSLVAAVQCRQSLVKFFDAETGKVAAKFDWKLGEMRSVAFSPDGTLAAAGSASGKVVVWDLDE